MVNMKQKNLKKIIKFFDSLIEKTLFELKNKTNRFFGPNSKVSNFNKAVIAFISLLFIYLFYLSIPTLYNKSWVQNTVENQLSENFNMNFSTSYDITYNILPAPHFLIKNSKLFRNNDEKKPTISEIKKLKVFISQGNFFNKDKINIKKLLIDDANFSLQEEDLIFLNQISYDKFSNKKISINNSNIFLKNDSNETITIIKIKRGFFFNDDLKKKNLFNINGEIFNSPFILNLSKDFFESNKRRIDIEIKKLKLNFFNESEKKDNLTKGINIFSTFNSKIQTEYSIDKNLIYFKSDTSTIKNPNLYYDGKLSFKPFDLKIDVNLQEYDLSKIINIDSVMGELIQSKLLFNENISANILVNLDSNKNSEIFTSSVINFSILNNKINFDKTKLINKKIGFLELDNSDLFIENNRLILNTDININVQNSKRLFSFFLTPRKLRNKIEKIFINLDYDFLSKQLIVNSIKIDKNESNDKMMDIIKQFNDSDDYNLNKSRRVFNELLSAYAG